MPEFSLNTPHKEHPFYALSTFAKGYVEAMFFTNGDIEAVFFADGYVEASIFATGGTGDERENLLNALGVERLTRASVEKIAADCARFLAHVMPDGATVEAWIGRHEDYEEEQGGRDLWLSRQGHGAGFFDRDELKLDAEALQDAARAFGNSYVEVHKGWIHVS